MNQSQIDRLSELLDEELKNDRKDYMSDLPLVYRPAIIRAMQRMLKSDELRDIVKGEWNVVATDGNPKIEDEYLIAFANKTGFTYRVDVFIAGSFTIYREMEIIAWKKLDPLTLPQPPITKEK